MQGRLQQQNIINFRSGPILYAAYRIQQNSAVSSFRIRFNESMLRHIRKCTITEAQRVKGIDQWSVSFNKMDKVIDLVIAQGVIGDRKSM